MGSGATISPCGRFRYELWRETGLPGERTVLFVMLNPSTADADQDDPTIRRCLGFARGDGAGVLRVVNLFPLRATNPEDLWAARDRHGTNAGVENYLTVVAAAVKADLVIAAWGAGVPRRHEATVVETIRAVTEVAGKPLHVLGLSKAGHPRHPLYLKGTARPVVWKHRKSVGE